MPVTVDMIVEKEFQKKPLGYDIKQVDDFLNEICDTLEQMEANIADLTKKAQAQQRSAGFVPIPEARPLPLQATTPPSDLVSAQKLLEKTQLACDEILEDAKKRAAAIVKEATPDPEVEMLTEKRDALKSEIKELEGQLEAFRSRMQSFFTRGEEDEDEQ